MMKVKKTNAQRGRRRHVPRNAGHAGKRWEVTKMAKTFKPGQKAPVSGQYEIIGPRGAPTGVERTVTKHEPLPPPPKPGETYKLVDPTKH
jgi:hypothetical protein